MREIPLSEFGLATVAEVCARKGWAPKTVQNWIRSGLLAAAVVGSGRSAKYLLRLADVEDLVPPRRGAPPGNRNAARKKKGRRRARGVARAAAR